VDHTLERLPVHRFPHAVLPAPQRGEQPALPCGVLPCVCRACDM